MEMLRKTNSVNQKNVHLAGDYTVEDKRNVINFHKSGRKKPKQYELESLQRQYKA
tara:strand:- start:169 stop:333 length:165 start_codon:yes stop_codon:yes gene_type:complete